MACLLADRGAAVPKKKILRGVTGKKAMDIVFISHLTEETRKYGDFLWAGRGGFHGARHWAENFKIATREERSCSEGDDEDPRGGRGRRERVGVTGDGGRGTDPGVRSVRARSLGAGAVARCGRGRGGEWWACKLRLWGRQGEAPSVGAGVACEAETGGARRPGAQWASLVSSGRRRWRGAMVLG